MNNPLHSPTSDFLLWKKKLFHNATPPKMWSNPEWVQRKYRIQLHMYPNRTTVSPGVSVTFLCAAGQRSSHHHGLGAGVFLPPQHNREAALWPGLSKLSPEQKSLMWQHGSVLRWQYRVWSGSILAPLVMCYLAGPPNRQCPKRLLLWSVFRQWTSHERHKRGDTLHQSHWSKMTSSVTLFPWSWVCSCNYWNLRTWQEGRSVIKGSRHRKAFVPLLLSLAASGCQDHRAAWDLVLRAAVHGQQRIRHMAERCQEGESPSSSCSAHLPCSLVLMLHQQVHVSMSNYSMLTENWTVLYAYQAQGIKPIS